MVPILADKTLYMLTQFYNSEFSLGERNKELDVKQLYL